MPAMASKFVTICFQTCCHALFSVFGSSVYTAALLSSSFFMRLKFVRLKFVRGLANFNVIESMAHLRTLRVARIHITRFEIPKERSHHGCLTLHW